ncbi:hypothetical protein, partial [Rhizobium leucaenae]|uniref:hypothetical protein n=1 Tax=Rhizobium leucaenae TaxID=29450 RepID=UPI001AECFFDD
MVVLVSTIAQSAAFTATDVGLHAIIASGTFKRACISRRRLAAAFALQNQVRFHAYCRSASADLLFPVTRG